MHTIALSGRSHLVSANKVIQMHLTSMVVKLAELLVSHKQKSRKKRTISISNYFWKSEPLNGSEIPSHALVTNRKREVLGKYWNFHTFPTNWSILGVSVMQTLRFLRLDHRRISIETWSTNSICQIQTLVRWWRLDRKATIQTSGFLRFFEIPAGKILFLGNFTKRNYLLDRETWVMIYESFLRSLKLSARSGLKF